MSTREMIRLAQKLQHYWLQSYEDQRESVVPITSVISSQLKRLRHAEHTLQLARSHHLTLIEPELQQKVISQACSLRITLQDLEGVHFPLLRSYRFRDFYQDLVQLHEEFPEVKVNWDDSVLIVVTDSITLKQVELGAFALHFHWKQWAEDSNLACLQVIAEEPNSPEQNEEVTHPHVREKELCSGDAHLSLQKAFAEGRLAEAFLIIRAVLTNYNPASAYVRLEEWHGSPCYDCGQYSHDEDCGYCHGCHHDYCHECIHSCSSCDESRCLSCLDSCSVCEDRCCSGCLELTCTNHYVCRSCRETCPGCQQLYGPGELDAETRLCHDCVDDTIALEESPDESLSTAAT
ncbi:MAG: hypothetical protein U0796_00060 [Gemmatales bacterium]